MRPASSLRATLTGLIIGGLLPLLVFSTALVIRTAASERAMVTDSLQRQATGLAADLDREISELQAPMFALAGSPALLADDLATFYKQAADLSRRRGWTVILTDLAAQQLINTRLPFGSPLPISAQRAAIQAVAATGQPYVSDLVAGSITGQPVVIIAIPVLRAGRPAFVLIMNVLPAVGAVVAQQHVQDPVIMAVLDRNSRLLARLPTAPDTIGSPVRPLIAARLAEAAQGYFETDSRDGVPLISAYGTVGSTGWRAVVSVPRQVLFAPVRWLVGTLLAAGALSILTAFAIAAFLGRRLTRQFGALTAIAGALGRGEPVTAPPAADIREIDAVGRSLVDAGALLDRRTAERTDALLALRREIADRRRIEQQLVQAQKMEAIGQLTGGIAHDFNNILGAVVGYLELAGDRLQADPEGRATVDAALSAAMHGAELTRRLLTFARQQPLTPRPIGLDHLLDAMLPLLRRTLGGHITITVSQQAGLWPAIADPTGLQDALLNLAINARDAMPGGGTLGIETANIQVDDLYAAEDTELTPGAYVMLTVSDTGTGMDPEVARRAFEPFFTTKEVGKGSGLGLSMVYGFARQSAGHVRIYSEVGLGTSVKLYLPRARTPPAPATTAPAAQPPPGGRESILLVEDHAAVREIARKTLTELGYQVHSAANAADALAVLDAGTPIDLLFTDIVMPGGLTGPALAEEARLRRPGLPVVFTSGYAGAAHGSFAIAHVLAKPYRRQELAERIRQALDL